MTTMVIALFERLTEVQRAVSELVASGHALCRVSMLIRQDDPYQREFADTELFEWPPSPVSAGTVLAAGPLAGALGENYDDDESPIRQIVRALVESGLRPAAARFFAEAIASGSILLAVHCHDGNVGVARRILDLNSDPISLANAPGSSALH